MQEVRCDECERKNCEERVDGAVCSRNKDTKNLIKIYETRDPVLIARKYIEVLGSEIDRYNKAKEHEKVGEENTRTVTTKSGETIEITQKNRLDTEVTKLAKSIISSGKIINDIISPPKQAPMFQQNNQYNIGGGNGTVKEIEALPENEKKEVIRFIDNKLDDAKRDN